MMINRAISHANFIIESIIKGHAFTHSCNLVADADGAENTNAASIVADRADFPNASFVAVVLCAGVADNVTIYGLLYCCVI